MIAIAIRKLAYYFLGAVKKILKICLRLLRKRKGKHINRLMTKLAIIRVRIDFIRRGRLKFTFQPDDIFIVTYPRSGTALMRMILFQLTTDGSMEFEHISQFIPFYDRLLRTGQNPEMLSSPRVFVTHFRYKWLPKGDCKYIYVARDGRDAMVSHFHFRAYTGLGYTKTFSQFFNQFMKTGNLYGTWFDHMAEWWSHRGDANILFLTYEALRRDLAGCIRQVADFLRIEIEPGRFPKILERCSFAFMKENQDRFDVRKEYLAPPKPYSTDFIRKGQVGEWKEYLSPDQQLRFEKKFQRRLGGLGLSLNGIHEGIGGTGVPENKEP
ncbi:MAG: sulfotransferase domain-containing protein [Candidatus Aminicenantes bacterium]|nr:MAG: sulfotransferase domain-containing protein [Candidatus Aminicenantes bacterium]